MPDRAPRTIDEALTRIPAGFVPGALEGRDVVYQFLLSGREARNFFLEVEDGRLRVGQGVHPDPSLTIHLSAEDYLRVVANPDCDPSEPQRLFLAGRIRVHPLDRELVTRLPEAFHAV